MHLYHLYTRKTDSGHISNNGYGGNKRQQAAATAATEEIAATTARLWPTMPGRAYPLEHAILETTESTLICPSLMT